MKCPSCQHEFEPDEEQTRQGLAACGECFAVVDLESGSVLDDGVSTQARDVVTEIHAQLEELKILTADTEQRSRDVHEENLQVETELKEAMSRKPKKNRKSTAKVATQQKNDRALSALLRPMLPGLLGLVLLTGFVAGGWFSWQALKKRQAERSEKLYASLDGRLLPFAASDVATHQMGATVHLNHAHAAWLRSVEARENAALFKDPYLILNLTFFNDEQDLRLFIPETIAQCRLEDRHGRRVQLAGEEATLLGAIQEERLPPGMQASGNLVFEHPGHDTGPFTFYVLPHLASWDGSPVQPTPRKIEIKYRAEIVAEKTSIKSTHPVSAESDIQR